MLCSTCKYSETQHYNNGLEIDKSFSVILPPSFDTGNSFMYAGTVFPEISGHPVSEAALENRSVSRSGSVDKIPKTPPLWYN